jgi:thiamine-phosphate pyrophosphorylase
MSKHRCDIYLTIDVSESATARLAAALDSAKIAAVMIAPSPARPLDAAAAKPLVELAQAQGVAAFIHGDATLARLLGADGVHIPPTFQLAADYATARKILGTAAMVGVDAGSSRHDAMEMAEAGADYIAFAVDAAAAPVSPDDGSAYNDVGDDLSLFVSGNLIAWWVDIFQTPCVALGIKSADDAARVAELGCEFIGVTLEPGLSPAATAAFVRAIASRVNHTATA